MDFPSCSGCFLRKSLTKGKSRIARGISRQLAAVGDVFFPRIQRANDGFCRFAYGFCDVLLHVWMIFDRRSLVLFHLWMPSLKVEAFRRASEREG